MGTHCVMKTPSHHIGGFFARSRDRVARVLLRLGLTPNLLTILGMLISLAAATAMALGRWPVAAAILFAGGACDMLDGAVARIGGGKTAFGGVLDSVCDRVGDAGMLGGIAAFYLFRWPEIHDAPPNVTYAALALLAIISTFNISYIRARVLQEIGESARGFWQRGERYAALLIGCAAANPSIILWQLGVGAGLTALYRLIDARRALAGTRRPNHERPLWERIVLFSEHRLTWSYDLRVGVHIALLVFARIPETDFLRLLFTG